MTFCRFWSMWALFVRPIFGRTFWKCLNPPVDIHECFGSIFSFGMLCKVKYKFKLSIAKTTSKNMFGSMTRENPSNELNCSVGSILYSSIEVCYQISWADCRNLLKRLKVKPISELRGVTCHMGSHSVTCNPTQVNTPRHNPRQSGRYSIYLPRRDGRLSRPR